MSLRDKTIHGVAWTLMARTATQILQYGVSVVMARLLSPADFGQVGMVIVFTGFASIFVDFGIGAALLEAKELPEEQADAAFSCTLAVGLVMTAGLFLAAPWIAAFYGKPQLVAVARASALGFTLSAVGIVPRVLFQRRMELKQLAVFDFAAGTSAALTGAGLAIAGAGVWAIVAMNLVGPSVNSFLPLFRSGWRPRRLFRFGPARPLFRMSMHLLSFNIVNYWARSLDNLLIGKRLGDVQLGYYSRAYALMLLPVSQINGVIAAGVLPAMARAADDRPRVLRGYLDAMGMIAFVAFPAMTGLALVATPFVRVLYGAKWAPLAPILQVLAIVGVLQALSNPAGWIYVSQGRTDRMARWGFGACSAIIAALVIGAWMGTSLTVAWAYLVVNIIIVPIGVAYAGELIGLTLRAFMRAISPSLLAALVMAAVLWTTKLFMPAQLGAGWLLSIQVVVGAGVYLGLSVLFRNPALIETRRLIRMRLRRAPAGNAAAVVDA